MIAKSQVLANIESRWGEMSMPRPGRTERNSRPGFKLAQEGAKATYPIIMVPGKSFAFEFLLRFTTFNSVTEPFLSHDIVYE